MTPILQFLASPLSHHLLHALGWTLLHFLWQGTITSALLWCALQLLDARLSQARYAAACIAFIVVLVLPLITFAHIAAAALKSDLHTWNTSAVIDPSMVLQVSAAEFGMPLPVRIAVALDHYMPWLLAAWLAGAIFFVARLNYGLLLASRLKVPGTETPTVALLEMFEGIKHLLGIRRAVRLLHSARVQVPTVIGWLRPVVLIPMSCLTGLSAAQIEAIFCHELAHVRRHDYFVSVLQSIAEALLFYHPAVWWISRQMRRERECCCDRIAVAYGADVLTYAKALSLLEERRAGFPEFVLGANGGVLTMRIKRLLGRRETAPASQFAALTLLALMLGVASFYGVTMAKAEPNSPPLAAASLTPRMQPIILAQVQAAPNPMVQQTAVSGPRQSPQGTYKAWLNEDAVYIITPQERTTFTNLTTDEQRDRFIDSFWQRRDPPGAAPGTTRQEHYTRIAYANEHFAAGRQPGWMTDRGRTYIVYGPPTEIESHASGGAADGVANDSPFEIWRYRSANGQQNLKFVDDSHAGLYKLASAGAPPEPSPPSNVPVAPGTVTPQGPVRVSAGVIAGNILSRIDPVYPPEAKAAHVQGVVVMRAAISKTGDIEDLQVISGPPMLTASALDAVRQWKYKPYFLNGEPTEIATTINVNYTLGGLPPAQDNPASIPSNAPVRVSASLMSGMVVARANPVYPTEARAAGVQGSVVLRAIIGKDGSVEDVRIISGVPGLNESAVDAVKQWKYKPFLLNGQPVEVDTTISVNYSLPDPGTAQLEGTRNESIHTEAEFKGMPIHKIGAGVTAPLVIHQVEPEFTKQARKKKFSGVVMVNLIVDEKGRPQNTHVIRRVGMGLDEKAVEAVSQYRFKPAEQNGTPVPVSLNVEVNFQIF